MKIVKKSLNIPEDLAARIDAFVHANPGTSFTLLAIQALEQWLIAPEIQIKRPVVVSKVRTDGSVGAQEAPGNAARSI